MDASSSEERRSPAITDPEIRARVQRADAILTGSLIPDLGFAHEWGLRLEDLEQIERAGGIFWVTHADERFCLAGLLEVDCAAVTRVCVALGAASEQSKQVFWMRRHPALGDVSAIDAIKHGRLREVLALAGRWPEL